MPVFNISWTSITSPLNYVTSNLTQYIPDLLYPFQIIDISGVADSNAIGPVRGNPYTFVNEETNENISSWIGYIYDGNNTNFFKISFTMNDNNEVTTTCAARYILGTRVEEDGQPSAIDAYNSNESLYSSVTNHNVALGNGLKELVLTVWLDVEGPYLFQNTSELQTAVNSWINNKTLALNKYGEINTWDTSLITNMNRLFSSKPTFNDDISNWNVSNVTDMAYMFASASSFNQDISQWNVSSVKDMERCFTATNFNEDISQWNVSNVTNMKGMFLNSKFNTPISNWNVSNVTNMSLMFWLASKFNQDISQWNVSSVTTMQEMFSVAREFNQDISYWDVSSVTSMEEMFYNAQKFNQDISFWNVSNGVNIYNMFNSATLMNANGIGPTPPVSYFNQIRP